MRRRTVGASDVVMKLFNCQHCDALLFFENRVCGSCGSTLGYLPEQALLSALRPAPADHHGEAFTATAVGGRRVRLCANATSDVCNWLVDARSGERFCAACRHNRVIPDIGRAGRLELWRRLEIAKHRLFYSLIRLGVRLPNRVDDPAAGLVFDFLDEMPGGPRVLTGHDRGIITIAAKEADDAHREEMRAQMHESYRTLLGHFRHEVGHWIWDRLVRDGGRLEACRAVFGDERTDYGQALARYYAHGPAPDWQQRTISAYATSHPWEDFAESWAHYLHIMDTLETARAFGIAVHPKVRDAEALSVEVVIDPYLSATMDPVVDQWLPLTFAMNNLNRSMGLLDLYPFIISPPVREKLGFIHVMLHEARQADPPEGR